MFPDSATLARAPRKEVLKAWSGLGYNRRAIALHRAAGILVNAHGGSVPKTREELLTLPGVGEYTAGAVLAFAYNEPVVIVETNIRTVVLHHCVKKHSGIGDKTIAFFVEQLLNDALERGASPKIFYSAMMDYGAHLKASGIRLNTRSKHYTKQKKFTGSVRQARGALLQTFIASEKGISEKRLQKMKMKRVREGLHGLIGDGLIEKRNGYYYLADS